MYAIFWLIDTVIGLYITVVIVQVVLSWLVAFNVVNTRNRFVYLVGDLLYRLTEPALAPIRRFLPSFGGMDVSRWLAPELPGDQRLHRGDASQGSGVSRAQGPARAGRPHRFRCP